MWGSFKQYTRRGSFDRMLVDRMPRVFDEMYGSFGGMYGSFDGMWGSFDRMLC